MKDELRITNYELRNGFTLVEALLSISIFAAMTLVVLDVFSRSQIIQTKASALQKLQDDSRFIMNKLAIEIRNGSVNYACYSDPTSMCGTIDSVNGNNVLALKNKEGKFIFVKKATTDGECGVKNNPCILIGITDDVSAGIPWSRLSSNDIKVPALLFTIFPAQDPFALGADGITYQSNDQPRVRISLSEESTVSRQQDKATVSLQTLVSTREYKR